MDSTLTRTADAATPDRPATPAEAAAPRAAAVLSREASEMMRRLPAGMLRRTAQLYPHVIERIAATWAVPRDLHRTLDDLLFNDRTDRAGFPLEVVNELGDLRERYERWVGARAANPFRHG
jgi:hypothetical protein